MWLTARKGKASFIYDDKGFRIGTEVRVKIEKACKLLRDTEKALVEIGLELGFCDQSAFTAQFRKRMSMTPRQYRAQFGRNRPAIS